DPDTLETRGDLPGHGSCQQLEYLLLLVRRNTLREPPENFFLLPAKDPLRRRIPGGDLSLNISANHRQWRRLHQRAETLVAAQQGDVALLQYEIQDCSRIENQCETRSCRGCRCQDFDHRREPVHRLPQRDNFQKMRRAAARDKCSNAQMIPAKGSFPFACLSNHTIVPAITRYDMPIVKSVIAKVHN